MLIQPVCVNRTHPITLHQTVSSNLMTEEQRVMHNGVELVTNYIGRLNDHLCIYVDDIPQLAMDICDIMDDIITDNDVGLTECSSHDTVLWVNNHYGTTYSPGQHVDIKARFVIWYSGHQFHIRILYHITPLTDDV